jgi:hypothetical protein
MFPIISGSKHYSFTLISKSWCAQKCHQRPLRVSTVVRRTYGINVSKIIQYQIRKNSAHGSPAATRVQTGMKMLTVACALALTSRNVFRTNWRIFQKKKWHVGYTTGVQPTPFNFLHIVHKTRNMDLRISEVGSRISAVRVPIRVCGNRT